MKGLCTIPDNEKRCQSERQQGKLAGAAKRPGAVGSSIRFRKPL